MPRLNRTRPPPAAGGTLRCLVAAIGLVAASPTHAGAYSALYAFGDSLSDAGNLFIDTGGAYYAPPYAMGRASNGPTWVEDLSLRLGLGPLTASEAGGNDYAYGFAATGPALPGAPASVPGVNQQVARFTVANGGVAPSTGLYIVWIGANDIARPGGDRSRRCRAGSGQRSTDTRLRRRPDVRRADDPRPRGGSRCRRNSGTRPAPTTALCWQTSAR